jgi:hypothetical protein
MRQLPYPQPCSSGRLDPAQHCGSPACCATLPLETPTLPHSRPVGCIQVLGVSACEPRKPVMRLQPGATICSPTQSRPTSSRRPSGISTSSCPCPRQHYERTGSSSPRWNSRYGHLYLGQPYGVWYGLLPGLIGTVLFSSFLPCPNISEKSVSFRRDGFERLSTDQPQFRCH